MSVSLKKLWNDYGVGGVLIAIIVLYGLYMLYNNLMSKGSVGGEMMSQDRKKAYNNSSSPSGPQPAQESGNEVYSSVGAPLPLVWDFLLLVVLMALTKILLTFYQRIATVNGLN